MKIKNRRFLDNDCQRGNALFLILIAVALFAALSYAVTLSGRGGSEINREQAMINSGRITQHPALLHAVITRMIVTGTAATTIDFTAGTGLTKVFDPAGGGAVREPVPAGVGAATTWNYEDIRDPATGYYIKDIGTNINVTGREIIASLHDLSVSVCQQMQKGLGLSPTPAVAAVPIVWATPLATYDVTAANTISGAGIDGHPFSCIQSGAVYDYYHALLEQ